MHIKNIKKRIYVIKIIYLTVTYKRRKTNNIINKPHFCIKRKKNNQKENY